MNGLLEFLADLPGYMPLILISIVASIFGLWSGYEDKPYTRSQGKRNLIWLAGATSVITLFSLVFGWIGLFIPASFVTCYITSNAVIKVWLRRKSKRALKKFQEKFLDPNHDELGIW